MADDGPYEPDRVEGCPHPRMAARVFGQDVAAAAFLSAAAGGRLHHAWLLTGPRGIGKATLAWSLARALVAAGDGPVHPDVPDDHPVARRIAALSEPRLRLVRPTRHPETGRERRDITVDVVRTVRGFQSMAAPDGGWRAIIVDAADDMTPAASNALLKSLEEPPARTVFFLISHAPSRLLPTIRSRCRTTSCAPLAPPDLEAALTQAGLAPGGDGIALAQLAEGSAGEAARLLQEDGVALYAEIVGALAGCPDPDRARLIALTAGLGGAAGSARLDAAARLVAFFLARLARAGAGVPPRAEGAAGEAATLARLAPDPAAGRLWAEAHARLGARLAHGRAVNLDPSGLVLDTLLAMNETGRTILRP